MVLLAAALYTVYQQQQKQQQQQQNQQSHSNRNDQKQRLSFSDLYQQTIVRCTSPSTSKHTTKTTTTTSTYTTATSLTTTSLTTRMEESSDGSTPLGVASSSSTADVVFDDDVRNEWWNAVFGSDFLPIGGDFDTNNNSNSNNNSQTPTQGVGLAGIPFFLSHQIKIPASEQDTNKLGITIHRLPLGLYVRQIVPGSEADMAGIPLKAVLIAINGLPLLAEQSRMALERIWQYEGHFMAGDANTTTSSTSLPTTTTLTEAANNTHDATTSLTDNIRTPVALTFIHHGHVFETLLLSNPPWGISWAPCGNFPLVKRVYAAAERAGVPRGSLVLAVNELTVREMDHADTALNMRAVCEQGLDLTLHCAFTPVQARPPKKNVGATRKSPKLEKLQHDGVEITFHPLSTAFCGSQAQHNSTAATAEENPVHVLAEQVAAGMVVDGSRRVWEGLAPKERYPPCPLLQPEQVLAKWDPLQSLVYCLGFCQANYDHANFRPLPATATPEDTIARLQTLTSDPQAPTAAYCFVLQFISLICSSTQANAAASKELTSLLLKLSRQDEGFCQSLYFLLRSFISTFETRRRGSERNLMALLHCLELLRFAEKELASRPIQMTEPEPNVSRITEMEETPEQKQQQQQHQQQQPKRRSMLKNIFRKKKPVSPSKSRQVIPASPSSSSPPQQQQQQQPPQISMSLSQSPSTMYENMSDFLSELDRICGTIERSLQKSFRQKIAEWAMQPWSASKDTALAQVTASMRESLRQANSSVLLVNPVESTELLSAVDYDECYILPSAHFPILLTFHVSERKRCKDEEKLYQTTVELLSLDGTLELSESLVVHGAMAGTISQSGESAVGLRHTWNQNCLNFENRSSWGAPQTLSLRVSTRDSKEVGFGWVDLSTSQPEARNEESTSWECAATLWPIHSEESVFDEHGDWTVQADALQLKVKITTKCVNLGSPENGGKHSRKRMLLYKHDDDLRQEAFTVQFIKTCDRILQASGLDMKLLTFECIPVGTRRGFVEWVPGSVPLSEICQPFAGSLLGDKRRSNLDNSYDDDDDNNSAPSMVAKAGLTKYESLRRLQQNESLRRLGGSDTSPRGSMDNNPVQDYLRSVAYDASAPYLIRKEVMDRYVKSCAGYTVITYILGVGDRHLDNLLLHQSGAFFHCDYSFILGSDPKKYLPMRITEDMIHGMGGRESDNYAKFLSLAGAVFLTLRRAEYVRVLLSMVRMMESSWLPDVSENQTIHQAVMGMRDRLRLDLNEEQALTFMEELVESSLSSKMWLAVDAIHTLGKRINIS